MSNNQPNTTNISTVKDLTASFDENRIKFWILLCLQFCSVPCSIYIIFQYLHKRLFHQSYQTHIFFVLLIISLLFNLLELPFTQAYMYTSYVYPSTQTVCSVWTFIHYTLDDINLFLMAFASIQRYLLIFHPTLFNTHRKRIICHYTPIILCLLYPPLFYIGAIFLYKCKMHYNYTQLLCKWPCYFNNDYLSNIDLFFNNNTPLILIPSFCLLLCIRFFLQKHAMRQQLFRWRRDKKMILQLFIISALYLSMWTPIQSLTIINLYINAKFLVQEKIDYFYLLSYLIHLSYPFFVLFMFHDQMINIKRRRSVQPI